MLDEKYYVLVELQPFCLAFESLIYNKLLQKGYVDVSSYVDNLVSKQNYYKQLKEENSTLYYLFDSKLSNEKKLQNFFDEEVYKNVPYELTQIEKNALVCWVFRLFKKPERIIFIMELMRRVKNVYSIKNNIKFYNNIVYNSAQIELRFISSISDLDRVITTLEIDNGFFVNRNKVFYRGHSDCNYDMLPSLMRNERWLANEKEIINEVLIQCPLDFKEERTNLEKLVKMQHYGLPTRLLDITRNPLVALYFACNENFKQAGEIIIVTAQANQIKYSKDDEVTTLAALSELDYLIKTKLKDRARTIPNIKIEEESGNDEVNLLLHEVQTEKLHTIDLQFKDLLRCYIVIPVKQNGRIIKQDGAFLLCGMGTKEIREDLKKYKYKISDGKRLVLLIKPKDKRKILHSLANYSITNASLFPEIDNVSSYIKNSI